MWISKYNVTLYKTMMRFVKTFNRELSIKKKENKTSYSPKEQWIVLSKIYASGHSRIREEKYCDRKKVLLTPGLLSRHILVAFRDGQRTRVGFAQKFKFEFKSPPCSLRDQRTRAGYGEADVKEDLTFLVRENGILLKNLKKIFAHLVLFISIYL